MKKKLIPVLVLALSLGTGGYLMAQTGNDAVSVAKAEKAATLTADTVNASFQQVGGKVIEIMKSEEQRVKKGDILMKLDPTDIEDQIAKIKVDIAQMDVKIKQAKDGVTVANSKVSTQIQQAQIGVETAKMAQQQVAKGARQEDIERQKLAVDAAKEALATVELNLQRTQALFEQGAVPQANLDTAQSQYTAAKNSLEQQDVALQKLQAGATAEERNQAKLNIEKAQVAVKQAQQLKEEVENSAYNVDLLQKQKEALQVQLNTLINQKGRLVLKSSVDGKVTRVIPKVGENISAGAPVMIIETNQLYYDLYVDETQVSKFQVGQAITSHIVALNSDYKGTVRYITAAPQYAGYRMSREKGQSDLSSFQIRVDIPRDEKLLPGMTVEVNTHAITQK